MRIGIAGFGYMGKSRLRAILKIGQEIGELEIVGVYDPFFTRDETDNEFGEIRVFLEYEMLLAEALDWLIIATPHDVGAELCKKALEKDTKVLIEKPLGRSIAEAKELYSSQKYENQLWVGLNYRFFQGINQLLNDVNKGLFGELISINISMGHGYRPGGEKTWKLNQAKAGGGVLIDPGIHLLDLLILLGGNDIEPVTGLMYSGFWKTSIEEECHLLLRSSKVPMINFQVSVVKWRSTFRVEIYGKEGYGIVNGRGRTYGPQTYIRGKRWAWLSGESQRDTEELITNSNEEDVFEKELRALFFNESSTAKKIRPSNAKSALESMRLLSTCRQILGVMES